MAAAGGKRAGAAAAPAAAAPAARRDREGLYRMGLRWVLGTAWALKPPRTLDVPATLGMVARHYLAPWTRPTRLPDPETALRRPDGLVGICDDMSVDTLLEAYARGLYPWCHIGPMKWWAPAERMVLAPEDFHIEKNLRRLLRNKRFQVTFDHAFEAVMRACGEPRPGRPALTWITPRVIVAYRALHEAGHAHSVEVWTPEGELAGGAYGVAVGRAFFTESQFTRARDSSKFGFAVLNCHLQHWGFVINDGKHWTGHLAQLGFALMPRRTFNAILAEACAAPGRVGRWAVDPALDVGRWEPKAGSGSALIAAADH